MNKLLVTEFALGIKAPANDLAITIPHNVCFRAFMTERMLVDREDSFRAMLFAITDIRESLFVGGADFRHDEEENKCSGQWGSGVVGRFGIRVL